MSQLAATVTRAFNADSGPKQFEVGKIRFEAIVSLEWCFPCFCVDEPIVKVDRVKCAADQNCAGNPEP